MTDFMIKIKKQIMEKEKQRIILDSEINQLKITLRNLEYYRQIVEEGNNINSNK